MVGTDFLWPDNIDSKITINLPDYQVFYNKLIKLVGNKKILKIQKKSFLKVVIFVC